MLNLAIIQYNFKKTTFHHFKIDNLIFFSIVDLNALKINSAIFSA